MKIWVFIKSLAPWRCEFDIINAIFRLLWLIDESPLAKLSSCEYHRTWLVKNQNLCRWWRVAWRHQVITRTNVDKDLWHQISSLGHNGLKQVYVHFQICSEKIHLLMSMAKIAKQLLYPPQNEVLGGVYWFHPVRPSVRPSVCRQNRVLAVTSLIFTGPPSYLVCT